MKACLRKIRVMTDAKQFIGSELRNNKGFIEQFQLACANKTNARSRDTVATHCDIIAFSEFKFIISQAQVVTIRLYYILSNTLEIKNLILSNIKFPISWRAYVCVSVWIFPDVGMMMMQTGMVKQSVNTYQSIDGTE